LDGSSFPGAIRLVDIQNLENQMTLEILTYRVAMDQDDSDCLSNAHRVAEDNEEFIPRAAHDARIAQLERELAEATKDARRYRFLRNKAENFTTEWDQVCFSWRVGPRVIMVPPSNGDVDAAIDAVNEGDSRE
jgi:hypothetical protein